MIVNEFDTADLERLGAERRYLDTQLRGVDAALEPLMQAAKAARVPQVDVMRWTGMSREGVRLRSMTFEERRAERAGRASGA